MALRKGFGAELALPHGDDLRYDLAGLILRNAAGAVRSGLFPPTASAGLITSTATMAVNVAAFSAVAVRDGGPVFIANDGVTSVTIPNPPVSNSRLDVIWAKQDDASSFVLAPDGDNLPKFGVLAGIASGSPVRNPAGIPAGAVELGTILVPSTATNTGSSGVTITPTFQYTALVGTPIWVRNASELTALAATFPQGTEAYEIDNNTLYEYYAIYNASTNPGGATAAGWFGVKGQGQAFAQAAGKVATGGNTTGNTVVTFPSGRFSVAPAVSVTLTSITANVAVVASSISATQMTVQTFITSTGVAATAVSFDWVATQMTAQSATG